MRRSLVRIAIGLIAANAALAIVILLGVAIWGWLT